MTTSKFKDISSQRKRTIRSDMEERFRKKMRAKGGAAHLGSVAAARAGGTGSMKGADLTSLERQYAKTIRGKQKTKGTIGGTSRKDIARTERKTGSTSPTVVARQRMKSISKGGTVGKGTHAKGTLRQEAKAWKTKQLAAAGTDTAKKTKIRNRFKRMTSKS